MSTKTVTKPAATKKVFAGSGGAARRHRRDGHTPRPIVADVLAGLAGLGFGVVLALVVINESKGSLASPGGWWIAAARATGFVGGYLMLIMVMLIARIPWLERAVGQDQLVRWHRRLGGWPIVVITLHVILVTIGYAKLDAVGPLRQLVNFVQHYPDVLAAMVGYALLVMVGVSSYNRVRARTPYENWWVLHLYTYIALALAFTHQVVTGVAFLHHPLTTWLWIGAWSLAALSVLTWRVGLPLVRNLRYRLRIASVEEVAPGVFSVVCSGNGLSRLAVSGGQYFQWRFLTRGLWWQAHPYSLSALPKPPFLRVTVKQLGDHSSSIASLQPGTRVFVEGPYGAFTHHARSSDYVVLIGAGVGVTPIRAMLEDIPAHVHATVIVRASNEPDVVHRDEIAALVRKRGGVYHEVVGSRHHVHLNGPTLLELAPMLTSSDVFVCGPEHFTKDVIRSCERAGVQRESIHVEAFSF